MIIPECYFYEVYTRTCEIQLLNNMLVTLMIMLLIISIYIFICDVWLFK